MRPEASKVQGSSCVAMDANTTLTTCYRAHYHGTHTHTHTHTHKSSTPTWMGIDRGFIHCASQHSNWKKYILAHKGLNYPYSYVAFKGLNSSLNWHKIWRICGNRIKWRRYKLFHQMGERGFYYKFMYRQTYVYTYVHRYVHIIYRYIHSGTLVSHHTMC